MNYDEAYYLRDREVRELVRRFADHPGTKKDIYGCPRFLKLGGRKGCLTLSAIMGGGVIWRTYLYE